MTSDPSRSTGRPVEQAPAVDVAGPLAPESIARRVPFANNPAVGQRGRRTQQRIVAAALEVFGEGGYHTSTVADLAKRAGCSRVAFYQYFSSKEDVLRHLVGQVAQQVGASVEAMSPLTPDPAGWATIRAWVERYADVYDHFGAVFHAFESAARETATLRELNVQAATANIALIRSRLASATVTPAEADGVIGLLLGATARTFYSAEILRGAAPAAYPRARLDDALADVLHRALFGLIPGVNARPQPAGVAPLIEFAPRVADAPALRSALTEAARATHDALLAAGYEVFAKRGYHGARIDDVAAAAGLSHGIFYRYFANKADLARTLVLAAMAPLSRTLAAIPTPPEPGSNEVWSTETLRAWLRTYNETQVSEAGIIRIWVDATLHEANLGTDAAAALDWGRRQLAHFLAPRGFGDVDAEAVVTMALLDVFGSGHRSAETLEAAVRVIEGGLLGLERGPS